MTTFRVAVLECDTPIDPVVEKLGSYGKIFERFLKDGLKNSIPHGDIKLLVKIFNAVDMADLPKSEEIDAVLLTGSKHNAFGDEPWIQRLVEYIVTIYKSTQIPIVGICFGHQIIARALGARVNRSPGGWEISVDQIHLTPLGKSIFRKDKLALHQMHRDAVLSLPDGASNLGESSACEFQGLWIPHRAFTLQAHPEFNAFIMQSIVRKRYEHNVFDAELHASAISRSENAHDGALVAMAIWKFLLDL